jgi:hypothetical protein
MTTRRAVLKSATIALAAGATVAWPRIGHGS